MNKWINKYTYIGGYMDRYYYVHRRENKWNNKYINIDKCIDR